MAKKTYKEKLHSNQDKLPEIKEITQEKLLAKTGPGKMVIPSALELDGLMRSVPKGSVITTAQMRNHMNEKYGAVYTCPLVTGIFTRIAACAAEEEIETGEGIGYAWWRTLKPKGELNEKYPGGIDRQAAELIKEGHRIVQKGKKMFVEDYESALHHI